ncbi:MAG TPA: DUF6088 family protein [Rubrivivax sp.]|nr:DUF6088 family protein [Rubrivivax sp.]
MKLEDRMRLSIRRRTGHVVLRAELVGLGSASQVSQALKALQSRGELVRLGAGVYAKANRDADSGTVRPQADFETLAREAVAKLKLLEDSNAAGAAAHATTARDRGGNLVFDTGRRRVSRKLGLGGTGVAYVNDRTRRPRRTTSARAGIRLAIPSKGVAQFVRELARKNGVSYARTPSDEWAETVTRLAGDEVRSGPVQDLLIALKRAGKLSTDEMAALLVNYLRERKLGVRSV